MRRFLKRFRSKRKKPRNKDNHTEILTHCQNEPKVLPIRHYDRALVLPDRILSCIFGHVCPHALDDSLNSEEESMTVDGCMLCDMRNLSHCAMICRRWYAPAMQLLYQHVRIDAVHYCELEIKLSTKRRKVSWLNHNADPIDAPKVRLQFFMQTVRENQRLADLVLSLRVAYMTRESSKAELAATVSVLPNLRYVDLPSSFFSDDNSSQGLKLELLTRCPDIRRMKYSHGSEVTFSQIPEGRLWPKLEILELCKLHMDPHQLGSALQCLRLLRDLTLEGVPSVDDSFFKPMPAGGCLRPLQKLSLRDQPHITSEGLVSYLTNNPQTRHILRNLSISHCGVLPERLHEVVSMAPVLETLAIAHTVRHPFPIGKDIAPIESRTLRILYFEIINKDPVMYGAVQPRFSPYYGYLMTSLMSNSLPSLRDLYVREPYFPTALELLPPRAPFNDGTSQGLNHSISIYTKGLDDELEWNLTTYEPFSSQGRRTSVTRPVSFGEASLSAAWGGEARKSVLVGNGFGGYLAVPAEDERPHSSGSMFKCGGTASQSKRDLWR